MQDLTAQIVSLTCSEEATIYYSTDGYPPFAEASNTHSGSSPVKNIVIENTTRLQFFAIDNAGNREAAKSVDYFFNDVNEALTGLTANYDENLKHVQLRWNQKTDVQRYNIYRCMNMADRTILSDSQTYGYPPAKRLKIASCAGRIFQIYAANLKSISFSSNHRLYSLFLFRDVIVAKATEPPFDQLMPLCF